MLSTYNRQPTSEPISLNLLNYPAIFLTFRSKKKKYHKKCAFSPTVNHQYITQSHRVVGKPRLRQRSKLNKPLFGFDVSERHFSLWAHRNENPPWSENSAEPTFLKCHTCVLQCSTERTHVSDVKWCAPGWWRSEENSLGNYFTYFYLPENFPSTSQCGKVFFLLVHVCIIFWLAFWKKNRCFSSQVGS